MIIPSDEEREYLFRLEPEEKGELAKILKDSYGVSSRILRAVKNDGILEVDGRAAKVKSMVRGGEQIRMVLPREDLDAAPSDDPFQLIYEDSEILAVSKTPELVVHPTRSHPDGTLANRVAGHARDRGESYKIRFVNRLDRDTSGILIIAKNKLAHHFIQSRMRTDDMSKEYTVFVEDSPGHPIADEGTICLPIGRPDPLAIRREVMEDGREAITHYRVLERYSGAAKLKVKLETGRTHQIRVHLRAIGHPIIGDPLYNPESIEKFGLARQALHASDLTLPLLKKGSISLKADLPEDLCQLEHRLRG